MTVSQWDDFPVHQASEWIAHVATSDRNFYDRYYFNAFDTGGEFMAVLGLGQYPNLGVTDAFITVRTGDEQHVVRASRPLTDRSDLKIGPLRVEVLEPLKRLRMVCEPTEHTIAADLTWEGFGPAIPEPPHYLRHAGRVVFDTQRLAQMGSWSGTLEVGGKSLTVDPSTTWGSRDRSWGVRPVGEKEPDGIRQNVHVMGARMWNYFPMRFDDHSIFYILQEGTDGDTQLVQSQRVWLDGRIEELGAPSHEHTMEGREIASSVITFESGVEVRCTPMLPNYIAIGTGYGLEPDWRHGMWQGPELVVQGVTYQVPEIKTLGAYAIVDHSARFEYDGKVGYGLLEHSFMGHHPKYGLD